MKITNRDFRRRITLTLLLRILILIITILGLVYLVNIVLGREMLFTLIMGGLLIFFQVKSLTDYVLRINTSLVQFIDSVGREDGVQYNSENPQISDFELRVNQLKGDVGRSRFEGQKQKFLLKNAIDEMEHSLICIKNADEVIFYNKAFSDLIGGAELNRISDLEKIYPELDLSFKNHKSVMPGIVSLRGFKASLRCREFKIDHDNIRLYSIQNIQQEIDKNEIESWERLIQVLTHEIMNSLSPIISLSKSMQSSIANKDRIITGLSTIEKTGEGLINFITEYRKLSDLPPPDREEFETGSLFEQVRTLFLHKCEENNIKLEIDPAGQDLKLYADKFQLEQVVVNIVTNAIEALSGHTEGRIKLSARSYPDATDIIIEDNGPGIPGKVRDKIFIPFFSTKKKGSGIGLSLSKQILTNHNARISISSDPGVSTSFTISFARN
ncbi:MAG: HAMP domain-containing sensor histidine kinase [Marinilabiliaceae bacterium]|jgi:signal transduction histidine kinase|nr:HAMP domain-containing sensor histidine kinase [Marinilabiliaceae bacterium]